MSKMYSVVGQSEKVNIDFLYWLLAQCNKWCYTITFESIPDQYLPFKLVAYKNILTVEGETLRINPKPLRKLINAYEIVVENNKRAFGVG